MANSKTPTFYSSAYCEVCGTKRRVARQPYNKRKKGHYKHMFCPVCGKNTRFVEGKRPKTAYRK